MELLDGETRWDQVARLSLSHARLVLLLLLLCLLDLILAGLHLCEPSLVQLRLRLSGVSGLLAGSGAGSVGLIEQVHRRRRVLTDEVGLRLLR